MSYANPIWLEGRRKYWSRSDAYRFAPPGSPEAKMPGWIDPWATRVRAKEAAEEEAAVAFAADMAELGASHDRVRQMLAEVKYELVWRRLCRKYGYNPNQPRVSAGNPDGGRWTDGEGRSGSPKVRLAAMSWDERRRAIFGQGDLFSGARGEGGAGGTAPSLPSFRTGGPTAGVLQGPGKADIPLVSGTGGPASKMPGGASGFNLVTRSHVEGQAVAIMRESGMNRGVLYINNPEICSSCSRLLPRMLPSGTTLDVILPSGKINRFIGGGR
jgi:hypothetical protein